MIKNYIQLGQYTFIEIPTKENAGKYIDDIGICLHKWTDNDIQFGFSRLGFQNIFLVNFYVAVGLHYHIYNAPIEAIEAECLGTSRTDGAFWEENIVGKGYENEDKIKSKTTYVVVKILQTFPIPHITEIIENLLQKIDEVSNNAVESRYEGDDLVHYYLGKKIGINWNYEQVRSFISVKHHAYMHDFITARDYQTALIQSNYSCLDIELLLIRNRIKLAKKQKQ